MLLLLACTISVKGTMKEDEVSEAKPHHLLVTQFRKLTVHMNGVRASTKLTSHPVTTNYPDF